jgi:hypothetical protein
MAKIKLNTKKLPEYPADHKLGMEVPQGGSDCKKCEYVEGQNCSNKIFVKWNGSNVIPVPTDRYCCDFFETR